MGVATVVNSNAMFPQYPVTYCGRFMVNRVDVKLKAIFTDEHSTNIFGSVFGFDMKCNHSFFDTSSTREAHHIVIDFPEKLSDGKTCLEKQLEGVDEKLGVLNMTYNGKRDEIELTAKHMHMKHLNQSRCKGQDMDFDKKLDENDPSNWRRRLGEV